MRMRGVEFVGTPERPIDLRGWDLSGCDLTGARFEHVIADETTLLEDADLTDITGGDRDAILDLAQQATPSP